MNNNKATRPASKRRRAVKPNPVENDPRLDPTDFEDSVKNLPVKDKIYLKDQLPPNKYAKKQKAGTPTLGRETGYVTEVGLGNLRTVTAYDNSDIPT